jgi:rod shape-determining protein MreD
MSLRKAVFAMLFLFILEGTIMPWLIPEAWSARLVPHFTFVFVLYSALYGGRHTALILGLCFGFLQDIVYYGHMIGVHAFSMGLCGYLTGLLLERRRAPLIMALSVIGMGCLLYDGTAYMIYRVFEITHDLYAYALIQYMMPSMFLQLGFALAVYIPARRWFEGAAAAGVQEEE